MKDIQFSTVIVDSLLKMLSIILYLKIILEAILPCYMQQIQLPSYVLCEGKSERDIILQLAVAVRTMVHNSEGLSK